MKIYRIKNDLQKQIYIIASDINNAIKKFEEQNEEELVIKEIEYIGFCIIGE